MRTTPLTALLLTTLALVGCRAARDPEHPPASLSSASTPPALAHCSGIQLTRGLDLVVLGSGGPASAGRAASSYLIGVEGSPRIIVDAGPGSFARLGETGLPTRGLETILLTHLHIDHAGDVPALVKSRDLLGDEPVRFRILGPPSSGPYPSTTTFLDRLFGSEGAFAYLPSFGNELQFDATDLTSDLDAPARTVLETSGVVVSATAVDHADVPAVAYRIERAGRSIVVSGDLAGKRGHIVDLARGADVLVYDTAVLDPPGSPHNLYELHTPPRRIGEIARAAGVKMLVLTHIPPVVEARKDEVFRSIAHSFRGDVRFARDCMHLPL